MVALEAALCVFSFSTSSSSKLFPSPKPSTLPFSRPVISTATLFFSYNLPTPPLTSNLPTTRKVFFEVCSTLQEIATDTKARESQETTQKRKLYVVNLPWSFSVADIKNAFGQCGNVTDIEIIKQKSGRSRGFAFVTTASVEEAQAAIEKLDSLEVSGRIIRVEFAKALKKPSPLPASVTPVLETRHKVYVSNLTWKARSSHLREFFSANFNPVSSRVVFENPSGRSAGYGFVSFATREEAEAAISALDGTELLGRPLHLKFSERRASESGGEKHEEGNFEGQPVG